MRLDEKMIAIERPHRVGRFVVYQNPSRSQVIALCNNYRGLRGLCDGSNIFIADAMQWTHMQLLQALRELGFYEANTRLADFVSFLIAPETERLDSSYGKPRPFNNDWVLYSGNRYQIAKLSSPFQRILPVPTLREMIDVVNEDQATAAGYHSKLNQLCDQRKPKVLFWNSISISMPIDPY